MGPIVAKNLHHVDLAQEENENDDNTFKDVNSKNSENYMIDPRKHYSSTYPNLNGSNLVTWPRRKEQTYRALSMHSKE